MLASRRAGAPADVVRELEESGSWYFETKLDGHRCLAYVDNGEVTLKTRNGAVVTPQFPEVRKTLSEALLADTTVATVVLDGELVCFDAAGRPSLERIQRRASTTNGTMRAAATTPACLVAFDVLFLHGQDLRGQVYERRLYILDQIIRFNTPTLAYNYVTTDGLALWEQICELKLEGIVAKRGKSIYTGTRSPDWVKLKERD